MEMLNSSSVHSSTPPEPIQIPKENLKSERAEKRLEGLQHCEWAEFHMSKSINSDCFIFEATEMDIVIEQHMQQCIYNLSSPSSKDEYFCENSYLVCQSIL